MNLLLHWTSEVQYEPHAADHHPLYKYRCFISLLLWSVCNVKVESQQQWSKRSSCCFPSVWEGLKVILNPLESIVLQRERIYSQVENI